MAYPVVYPSAVQIQIESVSMRLIKTCMVLLVLVLVAYLGSASYLVWNTALGRAHLALSSPYEPISKHQEALFLSVEDASFYDHYGVDFHKGQGRSTLSSRVVEILYYDGRVLPGHYGTLQNLFKQVWQCCALFDPAAYWMAFLVDRKLTKEEQLRIVLSNVFMGYHNERPIYGLPTASLVYQQKPLRLLDDWEWLELVAMIENPIRFHPETNKAALNERVQRIKRYLRGACKPQSWLDTDLPACVVENDLALFESAPEIRNDHVW